MLSDGLDLDAFFTAIYEKLNDPEWEVRQHTLRLLRDLIKNVDSSCINNKTENIFEQLLENLGHISPAVRKAAVDCLRTYLKQNNNPDEVLNNLFKRVFQDSDVNNIQKSVVFGVILAVPFLIVPNISNETLSYLIQQVATKINDNIYREAVVRSLVRIRCLVGDEKFRKLFQAHPTNLSFESFEELSNSCNVETEINKPDKRAWSDFNDNLLEETEENMDSNNSNDDIIEDKVILETKIQLNSGPAVTLQLHEQSRQNSFNEMDPIDDEDKIR